MKKNDSRKMKEILLSFYSIGMLFKNYDEKYEAFVVKNIMDIANELNNYLNQRVTIKTNMYSLNEERYFSLIDLVGHVSLCLPGYVAKKFLLDDLSDAAGFSLNFMMFKDLTENVLNYETFESDDENENIIRDVFLIFYNALKILYTFIGN